MQYKYLSEINGPVIIAKGDADFAMHDMVLVGELKLIGEVIALNGLDAVIQVYEETSGLRIGEKVESTNEPISVELGPGMVGNVFDGIQRPLHTLKEQQGNFISRGQPIFPINLAKKWHFVPKVNLGDKIEKGHVLGEVRENEAITNKIMLPIKVSSEVIWVADENEYTADTTIVKVKDEFNNISDISMIQKSPVRIPREYRKRLISTVPLLTGQRIIDSIFPIIKGGTAAIPGGFGTGKTMLQHQLAKWCDADIIIYVGCGERGNEMTQVLEDFPKLIDPRTNRPLMERTILIANTSNMPVAAREISIYTGVTLAEYYRDMGYHVALTADSTSRWAEALREISGRLEEMPAEEGFPSYLPSRLSEFYGRAGYAENLNNTLGSVTIIGAISPQGSDFSEPVTQNTKRYVRAFWGLDRDLAYSRHYPAINWNISYSEYAQRLEDWYSENVDINFNSVRKEIIKLLEEENELIEITKIVGQDVLQDSKKLVLETCKAIRIGFLQQSALNDIDTSVPLLKQYKLMELIINIYNSSLNLIQKGIPMSVIKKLGYFEEYAKLKFEIKNDEIIKFGDLNRKYNEGLKKLEKEYENHIQTES